jgi:hypothetical protein
LLEKKLTTVVDEHPGAAWLLSSGTVRVGDEQCRIAQAARLEWVARGALDLGYLDITGKFPAKPQAQG